MPHYMPTIIEQTNTGERAVSLDSRLLQDRIIIINSGVDANLAHVVNAQLLYLDSISSDDIKIYLTSPGGSVHSGLSMQDTMAMCRSDIVIIGSGELCSMGCYLLSQGTPGKRFVTSRAKVMAHQVSSGTQGHIADQLASLRHSETLNDQLGKEIAKACGKPHAAYLKDVNRDFWLNADEAVLYGKLGFADGVIDGSRDDEGELIIKRREDLTKNPAKKTTKKE